MGGSSRWGPGAGLAALSRLSVEQGLFSPGQRFCGPVWKLELGPVVSQDRSGLTAGWLRGWVGALSPGCSFMTRAAPGHAPLSQLWRASAGELPGFGVARPHLHPALCMSVALETQTRCRCWPFRAWSHGSAPHLSSPLQGRFEVAWIHEPPSWLEPLPAASRSTPRGDAACWGKTPRLCLRSQPCQKELERRNQLC